MNNSLDIFFEVAEKESLTITGLEKAIGASKGVLSRAKKNNSDVQMKWFISLVENFPHYDYQYFLTGNKKNDVDKEFSGAIEEQELYKNPELSQTILDSENRIRRDLANMTSGFTKNFEVISEGIFRGLKEQQKILEFIDQIDVKKINEATGKLEVFLKG